MYEKRGGAIFGGGKVHLFGKEIWLPYFSATWPLAVLRCYPDSIMVKIGPLLFSVSLTDIEQVSFRKMTFWTVPLGGDTLTIRHRGKGPTPVIFGSYRGLESLVSAFKEMGVKVVHK